MWYLRATLTYIYIYIYVRAECAIIILIKGRDNDIYRNSFRQRVNMAASSQPGRLHIYGLQIAALRGRCMRCVVRDA
jgi:hypothetical protein